MSDVATEVRKPVTHYKLKYPVALAENVTIDVLKLSPRVNGKAMRSLSSANGDIDQGLKLLAGVAGIDDEIVDEMDESDIKAAIDIIKKNRDL